jgi:hypothetical protein
MCERVRATSALGTSRDGKPLTVSSGRKTQYTEFALNKSNKSLGSPTAKLSECSRSSVACAHTHTHTCIHARSARVTSNKTVSLCQQTGQQIDRKAVSLSDQQVVHLILMLHLTQKSMHVALHPRGCRNTLLTHTVWRHLCL